MHVQDGIVCVEEEDQVLITLRIGEDSNICGVKVAGKRKAIRLYLRQGWWQALWR